MTNRSQFTNCCTYIISTIPKLDFDNKFPSQQFNRFITIFEKIHSKWSPEIYYKNETELNCPPLGHFADIHIHN